MKRILVIEDARDVREVIAEGLVSRGWETLLADDGDVGVALARENVPDLILCDIRMPRMDGYAVLQNLRENPKTAAIPFIFLTGLGERPHMRQAMELGADDYLLKPFTIHELIAAVDARFRKQELLAERTEKQVNLVRESLTFALPHELVTPLNTILGFSSIMIESPSLSPNDLQEFARHIHSSGERLKELIEKFLLHAQLETVLSDPAQKANIRQRPPAPLRESIEALADRFAREAGREKDVVLKIEPLSHNIGAAHLHRLLRELMENAFKFSSPGAAVVVWAMQVGSNLHLTVRNAGKGFAPEQIRDVTANVQFDRKLREQQGTGLGLGIVRRLAELYGGTLRIESIPDEHTTVTVQLPL